MIHRENIKSLFIPLLILCLLCACNTEDPINSWPDSKQPLDVSVRITPQTRTDFDGKAFVNGDSFVLYEDVPSDGTSTANYQYDGDKWTTNSGLYWDDLDIWNGDGSRKTDDIYFTGILTNGGNLTINDSPTKSSFTIAADQSNRDDFLKNDLLVADDKTEVLKPLKLTFNHVMGCLIVELTDNTGDNQGSDILGAKTKLTLDKAIIGNEIEFGASKEPKGATTVMALGNKIEVTLLQSAIDKDNKKYTYEIILPAQSLRDATLTIAGNGNQKEYFYKLENVKFVGVDEDLLLQGHKTTLSLSIKKTSLTLGEVKVEKWVKTTASGVGTPDDYPIIKIGGDSGGEEPTPNPGDGYAGKTIELEKDMTLEELQKILDIPIGTKDAPFRGTFDGKGYTIMKVNLNMNADFLGIFGYTEGATIKNLNVTGTGVANSSKNSSTATGGLAGYVNNTTILNCHTSFNGGVSAAYDNAGGLVGYVNGHSRIEGCSANTAVSSGHDYAGGLVGIAKKGADIKYCFSIGRNLVKDTYAVKAENYYAGGLVGATYDVNVEYCYSWSDAKAVRYAAGLIGRYESAAGTNKLTNCYAAGQEVSGGSNTAGMVGYLAISPGYPNKCYWNSELGTGFIGLFQGGENSSFTLTTTLAAMNNVLNALNNDKSEGGEWELTRTDYSNYVLPTLISNKGKAESK